MKEYQITEEILRYLADTAYNYAVLIDGEWGCGKTYYIKNVLIPQIAERESDKRKIKYISLYGCKSVEDILDMIGWEIAEEINLIKGTTTLAEAIANKCKINHNAIFSSGKKIISAASKNFAGVNPFDIASSLVDLSSFIFVFDDLERCDCAINEVFGFINGLVEHENIKVILVANEKEINTKPTSAQLELQYIVALNNSIKWPKKKTPFNMYANEQPTLDLEELTRRRELLFSDDELDEKYGKIREKLIGVTLFYEPDIKEIICAVINKCSLPKLLKDTILENREFLYERMNHFGHHNLRTFQFFISKIDYLFGKICEMKIDSEYIEQLVADVMADCFIDCLIFKGNIKPPLDMYEKMLFDSRDIKLISVQTYVETGDFNTDVFKREIEECLQKLKNILNNNDPYKQLQKGYWLKSQEWVETKMKECLQRLEQNKYISALYPDIAYTFCQLAEIGFSKKYVEQMTSIMKKNASTFTEEIDPSTQLHFFEAGKERDCVKAIIDSVNEVILENSTKCGKRTYETILDGENWASELTEYVNVRTQKDFSEREFLHRIPSEKWVRVLKLSSSDQIYTFNRLVNKFYSNIYPVPEKELSTIHEIVCQIKSDEEMDLIVKFNLLCLIKDLNNILQTNERYRKKSLDNKKDGEAVM